MNTNEIYIANAICNKCGNILPDHTVEEHNDPFHSIHVCPHTNQNKQMYNEIAKEIIEEFLRIGSVHIGLPVDKIDNVKVSVWMRLFKSKAPPEPYIMMLGISYKYATHGFNEYTIGEINTLNVENVSKLVEESVKKINQLKYDSFHSVLTYKPILKTSKMFATLLSTSDNVKLLIEKCCVCYEFTNAKTDKCNHPLCMICYDGIEKLDCCDDDCISCPICREEVSGLNC